ncbi:hypothetical protein P9112_001028 [Eukaryota sp. TZLM1-RC]
MVIEELYSVLKWMENGLDHDSNDRKDRATVCYNSALAHLDNVLIHEANDTHRQVFSFIKNVFQKRVTFITDEPKFSDHKNTDAESEPSKEERELTEFLYSTVVQHRPHERLCEISGIDGAKQSLMEAVVYPKMFPELFQGLRQPWRSILLHGPPGTGKTLLAKATAGETGACYFEVPPSALLSRWTGESERFIKRLFKLAETHSPTIIFFDEIDSLGGSRNDNGNNSRRILTELLIQMTNMAEGITIIAATNCEDYLDDALRRRFEKRILVPLPDLPARIDLFRMFCRETNTDKSIDWESLGQSTEGYSGADIKLLCREASMIGVRELYGDGCPPVLRPVNMDDFQTALSTVLPSIRFAQ